MGLILVQIHLNQISVNTRLNELSSLKFLPHERKFGNRDANLGGILLYKLVALRVYINVVLSYTRMRIDS